MPALTSAWQQFAVHRPLPPVTQHGSLVITRSGIGCSRCWIWKAHPRGGAGSRAVHGSQNQGVYSETIPQTPRSLAEHTVNAYHQLLRLANWRVKRAVTTKSGHLRGSELLFVQSKLPIGGIAPHSLWD